MAFRVTARAVSRVYGRQRALSPVSLTLDEGEAVALLGANGAGKSTLCAILGARLRPTTGEVSYAGQPPSQDSRRLIGLCAHESLCYGDLSGRENLVFFARLHHVAEPERRVDQLLDRVGLAAAAARMARTYSRGMVQRLALARAILHTPRLLLLDEPFTGLDRDGVATARALLEEERARGTIVVTITHDLEAAAGRIDRALVLTRGRLVYDGAAPPDGAGLRALYRQHGEAPAASAEAGRAA